ncbi:LysR family transcriptional regulator [Azorhizobium oxalatiphilum]|uniref:LysR family transcriptional regulator n=1 Tax=Azorhizobium oxalatiphilum TaxID=980631 RepID=A0A917C0Q8_9HYPH|nr:LysR family transcriptional regulator [Azorhizobium oxalatiphilum]GGF62488.1 LysR family transcriptional regulator [Azorhizobium oxalatiphilum]
MMEQERFVGLTEFVASVRFGSFTAAAAQLGVTGSAIGKSVSRLEARLGIKLIHRTTRRLTLTNEGQEYHEACLRILEQLETVETGITTGRENPVGTVRLSLPGAFGRRHVMPVLMQLANQHRHLDLAVIFTERTSNIIDENIDLAVRIGMLGNDTDLVAKRLGTQKLLICASPDYLARCGAPSSAEDLVHHDCIIGWRRVPRPVWLLKDAAGGLVPQEIKVRHEFSDGEAMVQAVLAGGGLCQLPTWLIADHLAVGALIPVLEEFAGAEMPIHAVWPTSRYLQPKLRVIIDALFRAAQQSGSGFQP